MSVLKLEFFEKIWEKIFPNDEDIEVTEIEETDDSVTVTVECFDDPFATGKYEIIYEENPLVDNRIIMRHPTSDLKERYYVQRFSDKRMMLWQVAPDGDMIVIGWCVPFIIVRTDGREGIEWQFTDC